MAAHHESNEKTEISKLAYQAVKVMAVSEVTMQAIHATIAGTPKQMEQTIKSQEAPSEFADKIEESLENKISALKEEIDFDAIEDKLNHSFTLFFLDVYSEEELNTLIGFIKVL